VLYGYAPQEPRPAGLLQFNQQLSDLTSVMYRRLSTTVEVLILSSMHTLVLIKSECNIVFINCVIAVTLTHATSSCANLVLLSWYVVMSCGNFPD
jgi:hypothetical protein